MQLNQYIDHTVLKPDATPADIVKLCDEAKQYNFKAVCVNSCYAKLAMAQTSGSDVLVACVIGFPLGAMSTEAKVFETQFCVDAGAHEIDMVINVGALKSGDIDFVERDIAAVCTAAGRAAVKVIIETCLLTDVEKVAVCEAAVRAGAAFVKTSTGFSSGGATADDVKLMRRTVGTNVGVKASGGVRDRAAALAMVEAGASRIGTSSGIAIVG